MLSGILLIDKPQGITSADVVFKVRKALALKRVGHSGTLDPMATGLVVCLLGPCTRFASFAEAGTKVYSGTIRLGLTTDSDDITGAPLEEKGVDVSDSLLSENIQKFIGNILQIPPKVSAVKVNGKRAYALAREGQSVELKARNVTIESFSFLRKDNVTVDFEIKCGKGTYIRSIARDLGEALGCGGCLTALRRVVSYPYSVADACTVDKISPDRILEWGSLFPNSPRLELDHETVPALLSGNKVVLQEVIAKAIDRGEICGRDHFVVYSSKVERRPLGLLSRQAEEWSIGVNIG